MKKASMFLLLCASVFSFSLTGCGGKDAQVIEAPVGEEDASAMEGMDDDEYNKAMSESMSQ